MGKRFFTILLLIGGLGLGWGCKKEGVPPGEVGLMEAEAWLKAGEALAVDVNVEEVRQEYGVLPGAVLLDSASSYEVGLLPKDKSLKLIFYCLNKRCTASHIAAKRAQSMGYKRVYVLSEGIQAWKEAKLPASTP
ncbi:MAG: rhodanese-like domain-containing protein [Cystobacterineae bacterium]|nr:rhodanese-like domain-containing protein [Cystobacterineae bacterium]